MSKDDACEGCEKRWPRRWIGERRSDRASGVHMHAKPTRGSREVLVSCTRPQTYPTTIAGIFSPGGSAQFQGRWVPPDPNEFWREWLVRLGRDVGALLAETVDPPDPVGRGRWVEDVAEIRRAAIALEALIAARLEG